MTTIVLLLLGLSVHPQDDAHINPFTYRKKVTAIGDNFGNFFRNVKQIVDNPDSIQFVGYDYVGTVQNVEDAKKYLSENFQVGSSTVGFMVTDTKKIYVDEDGHPVAKPVRYIKIVSSLTPDIKDNQKRMNTLVNRLATQINSGYKVYQIHFVLNHKKMSYNVFVNPKTKQVMIKYNVFLLPAIEPYPFN